MYILLQPELHLFACWYGARVEISAMRDIPMLFYLRGCGVVIIYREDCGEQYHG